MLATTGPLPRRSGWAYEAKWDGMRALAWCNEGRLKLRARTGNDITSRYPELAELGDVRFADHAPLGTGGGATQPFVIDGEIVMFDDEGRPSFTALQHRMHVADPNVARELAAERSVMFVAFDVLWTPEGSCLDRTYDERRAILDRLAFAGERVLVPPARLGEPDEFVEFCRERGLEGIIAKRRDSVYRSGRRTDNWIKWKFVRSQELLVLGWTEGTGTRDAHVGALLLGYHGTDGELVFAGKVGTGFTDRELRELAVLLAPLARAEALVDIPKQRTAVHWVEPTLVVDVTFAESSPDGHLRHPSYRGRRADTDPAKVVREPG